MSFMLLLLTTGCYDDSEFIPDKTTAYCDLLIECTDPAVLAFDGITAEDCEGTFGPEFQAEGEGCKFRRRNAKACIEALTTASCPTDGPVEMPEICPTAFDNCPVAVPTVADDTGT